MPDIFLPLNRIYIKNSQNINAIGVAGMERVHNNGMFINDVTVFYRTLDVSSSLSLFLSSSKNN